MRMAFATLVLVIYYQGLFIDVITRSLYATGLKSIGIATQPLQSLPAWSVHLISRVPPAPQTQCWSEEHLLNLPDERLNVANVSPNFVSGERGVQGTG